MGNIAFKLVCRKIGVAIILLLIIIANCFVYTFANGILSDERIYEIKNPDCNCWGHSNYDYFLGNGDSLFKSDEEEHLHYYGVRDVETGEIRIIREIKYRKIRQEEWYDSDPGYRCVSIKYYDKDKKLVYTYLEATNDSDVEYGWSKEREDIICNDYMIIAGRTMCIDIKTGKEDKVMHGKFTENETKKKNEKEKANTNIKNNSNASSNTQNYKSVLENDKKKTIIEKVSFNYKNDKITGYKINDIYVALASDKTFILNKNNELIKELPKVYENVTAITDDGDKTLLYEFKHGGSQFYYDVYDIDFNLTFEKVESCWYNEDLDCICINKKDNGIYEEGNYYDGMYTILYDKKFNIIKKFDTIKGISTGHFGGKECYFADDLGYESNYGGGETYRAVYDLNFKLIKDDINDMFGFKNDKTNEIFEFITDSKSTKVYKDNKLVKDLKYKIKYTHIDDYTSKEWIFRYGELDNWSLSRYYAVGIYPIMNIKDKIFIRTGDGAKVLDDKFDTVIEGYKEFIDFNEEYFTFCKDKSYGFMDFNLKELVKFDRK